MNLLPKRLRIAAYISLGLLGCGMQANGDTLPGFMEGHLKIVSLQEVELAGASPAKSAGANYAEYPLVILNGTNQKEVAHVTADEHGNYRVALPPGNYVLDVEGRGRRLVRAKPRSFAVVSNQTVKVDIDIDTGIR